MESWFEQRLEALNIRPTSALMEKFALYHAFLTQKNAVMNLTAITEEAEVYKKHFLDSLYLIQVVRPEGKTLLDVGSGAGFPSLPLKLVFPDLRVTIVDSLEKRIQFLRELTAMLGLTDVVLVHGRAEEMQMKNQFDIVTARAVARLDILSELCLPFVKTGGVFIAMKAPGYEAELKDAQRAIQLLGGLVEKEIVYPLDETIHHVMIRIRKQKATEAKYPRPFAQIKKNPL